MYKPSLHFHFVGVGGIGMSALAHILHRRGYRVSGCDQDLESTQIEQLHSAGCAVLNKNNSTFCLSTPYDVLVYSTAISHESPEVIVARKRDIPVIHRSEVLRELMRLQYGIGVTGSHGKTTTSSLISHILLSAHFDPTVVVGGIMHNIHSNAHAGSGKFLVAEADESDRSFLQLHPAIGVVTNIDLEHLETYTDMTDITESFLRYINQIPFYGAAIINADDPHTRALMSRITARYITFGINNTANIRAHALELGTHTSTFTLMVDDVSQGIRYPMNNSWGPQINYGRIELPMAGIHNVSNCLAAIATALEVGASIDDIKTGIKTFLGVERRFTHKLCINGTDVYDDYGHHPKEIEHTFTIAKKCAQKKLVVVFQPHRYSRTAHLWDDFISVFKQAPLDKLIITDIYAASESPIAGISGQSFAQALQKQALGYPIEFISAENNYEHILHALKADLEPGNLILLQGAGRLDKLPEQLK